MEHFLCTVKSHGRARTLNGSGHTRTKGTVKRGGKHQQQIEEQNRLRLGQMMGVARNKGHKRMNVVDNMATEANSQEGKTGNLEGVGLGSDGRGALS